MLVLLPPETSKALGKVESDEVKILIQLAREASDTAGNALMACAAYLYSIKGIVKKKGWTGLCDSGAFGMGSKQAQMLALCHERLFLTGAVPPSAVANVSITTMYLMASSDDKKRGEMVAAMIEAGGNGFTAKEARAIKNKGKVKKAIKPSDVFDKKRLQEKLEGMSIEELREEVIITSKQNQVMRINFGVYLRRIEQLTRALKDADFAVPKATDITDEIAESVRPEVKKAIENLEK